MADKTISTTRTGGISFLGLIFLLIGCSLLGIQIFAFFGDSKWTESGFRFFLPGMISMVFFIMFGMKAFRKGEFFLYKDKLTGRTSSGKTVSFNLNEIDAINLESKALLLKDKGGKVLLFESAPHNRFFAGWLWLLNNYGDKIPEKVWLTENVTTPEPARRFFLDIEGKAESLDVGFVVNGTYFPVSDTLPYIGRDGEKESLSTQLKRAPSLIKFDPNPAMIPVRELVAKIMGPDGDPELLNILEEKHGVTRLPDGFASGEATLETDGQKIRIEVIGTEIARA